MFAAAEIEHVRLLTIAAAWRLIHSRRAPLNSPSEWAGWTVISPDADRTRYAERAAAKLCTRCGEHLPRSDRKMCEDCAMDAAARSAALRTRRKAAGACLDCARPTTGGHVRCTDCRRGARHG